MEIPGDGIFPCTFQQVLLQILLKYLSILNSHYWLENGTKESLHMEATTPPRHLSILIKYLC